MKRAGHLRAAGQQPLDAVQPLDDALGVVEPVGAEQDRQTVMRLADPLGLGENLGTAGDRIEGVDVDTDRRGRDRRVSGGVFEDDPPSVVGAARFGIGRGSGPG